jgi:hypothetical protein
VPGVWAVETSAGPGRGGVVRLLDMPAAGTKGTMMTSAAFTQRLQPELELHDLDTRARNAQRYALDALAAGDADRFRQAVERLLLRFGQYDALAPLGWPMRDVYFGRHGLVWAILEALGQEGHEAVFNQLLEMAYRLAAQSTGVAWPEAAKEAQAAVQMWRMMTPPVLE